MAEERPVKVEASRPGQELAEGTYSPVVDVYECASEVVLVAEVPGATREDISVQVDKGVLTLEANAGFDVPAGDYAPTYVAFAPGQYFRAFALSDEIDRERISATVANGVLTVRLPKAEAAQTRKITVNVED